MGSFGLRLAGGILVAVACAAAQQKAVRRISHRPRWRGGARAWSDLCFRAGGAAAGDQRSGASLRAAVAQKPDF